MNKENIIYRIKYILGGTQLSHNFYLFFLVHTLFSIFTRIPYVFVNTLLMNQTGDVNSTLFYNGVIFMTCGFTMFISAQIMHWTECRITSTIGIIFYNILYLCYILFQKQIGDYYMLFGMINGMADGFYFIGFGRMILLYTEPNNRDSGMGIMNTMNSTANLIIPFLSGSIITIVGGIKGYITIFVIAFVIAFFTLLSVFRLPAEKRREKKEYVKYWKLVGFVKKYPQAFWGIFSESLKGIREGALLFILNVILYQLVKSEFLIGLNSLLVGIASILCFWFMGRFIRPGNRKKYMTAAVIVLLAAVSVCMKFLNPVLVISFAVTNAFFTGWLDVSCYITFFDITQSIKEAEAYTPELLAVHEFFLQVGRCIGLFVFGVINTLSGATVQAQLFSIFILTLVQFITVLCCTKAIKMAALD